jgi:hypothetical protein
MTAASFDLELRAGDTETRVFYFWQDEAMTVPTDLTGRTYRAEFRTAKNDDSTASASLAIVPGVGTVTVTLTPTQTRALRDVGRRFFWDLEENAAGVITTIVAGSVTLVDDVTR